MSLTIFLTGLSLGLFVGSLLSRVRPAQNIVVVVLGISGLLGVIGLVMNS